MAAALHVEGRCTAHPHARRSGALAVAESGYAKRGGAELLAADSMASSAHGEHDRRQAQDDPVQLIGLLRVALLLMFVQLAERLLQCSPKEQANMPSKEQANSIGKHDLLGTPHRPTSPLFLPRTHLPPLLR